MSSGATPLIRLTLIRPDDTGMVGSAGIPQIGPVQSVKRPPGQSTGSTGNRHKSPVLGMNRRRASTGSVVARGYLTPTKSKTIRLVIPWRRADRRSDVTQITRTRTTGLSIPSCWMTSKYSSATGRSAGISKLIWYRPTKPGASPANSTLQGTPLIVTCTSD